MSGRPKIFDEKTVIRKAIDVFWKYGYEASSTEILLREMGIGKSSFYLAFPGGKKELFEKAIEYRSSEALKSINRRMAESDNKIMFIKELFMEILSYDSGRPLNGCILGNSVAELSNHQHDLKEKAAGLLLRLEKLFLKAMKQAQAEGSLSKKEKPELLAKYLLTVWNGLNISVRVYPNPELLKPLIEKQLSILK